MRLRTFRAANIAEAMAQVREALGDDAIIVSTHESGRGRGVQVTAAVEPEAGPVLQAATPETAVAAAAGAPLAEVLSFHGVPEGIAQRLQRAATELGAGDSTESLAGALDSQYAFHPIAPGMRPLILVGPPGAGKTVCVAKLAVRLAFQDRPATLITTDTVRAGAVAQLEGYAGLMGHRLIAAEDPEDLQAAVAGAAPDAPVLVDTAAANPFNPYEIEDLKGFLAAVKAEPVLVMPAGGDADDMAEAAVCFARLGCRHVIFTRLDAARRLGGMLTAVEAGHLSFSEVSVTSSVAEGLHALTAMSLARVLTRDPAETPQIQEAGAQSA